MTSGAGRKIAGGFNFIMVFWVLLTILRLSLSIQNFPLKDLLDYDLFTYIIPILFLAVLNVFIGITQFTPQKKNKIWLLSLIIATATLMLVGAFQTKLELYQANKNTPEVVEF